MSQLFTSGGQILGFSLSISSSNEYSGLISFQIDWFDLLAVQRTLKSLLQHHNSKASILWNSAFSMLQVSHPYMTTGKTVALIIQIFVSKVMSLLFNMLSRLVIAFLPRSKRLLISSVQSPSVVILEPRKIKSVSLPLFHHLFTWSDGTRCHDLHFLNVEFKTSFLTLLFYLQQLSLKFLFTFCRKCGAICISEVIDISPSKEL